MVSVIGQKQHYDNDFRIFLDEDWH